MPAQPCVKCMGLPQDELLREEAEKYGNAGSKPQVVWPNAILASSAVGFLMQLMTPWFKNSACSPLLEYGENRQTFKESPSFHTFHRGIRIMPMAATLATRSGEPIEAL